MTKSQKKLDRLHLTEEEKKLIRKYEAEQLALEALAIVGLIIIGLAAIWAITELMEW